jgi:mono/diheme cytochrome c family protein
METLLSQVQHTGDCRVCVPRRVSDMDKQAISNRFRRGHLALATSLLLGCVPVASGWAAEPAGHARPDLLRRGEHLAQLLCGACHVVANDQEFPPFLKQPAPSFFEIAARPTTNAHSLRRFLMSTHWDEKSIPMTMPDPLLTPEEAEALTDYILSLRPRS